MPAIQQYIIEPIWEQSRSGNRADLGTEPIWEQFVALLCPKERSSIPWALIELAYRIVRSSRRSWLRSLGLRLRLLEDRR